MCIGMATLGGGIEVRWGHCLLVEAAGLICLKKAWGGGRKGKGTDATDRMAGLASPVIQGMYSNIASHSRQVQRLIALPQRLSLNFA